MWQAKVFWQTIRRLRGERFHTPSDPKAKMVSYSTMRASLADEEYFENLLNLVTLTSDTQEVYLWEENTVTAAEVLLPVETLGGCDEMLTALNRVILLNSMCQAGLQSRRSRRFLGGVGFL